MQKTWKNLSSAERSQFVNDILFAIAGINDSIIRNSILKNIGQRLQIDENELLQRLKREQTTSTYQECKMKLLMNNHWSFHRLLQKAQLILVKLLANDEPQIRQFVRDKIDIRFN